jgi:hypothetical protein
MRTAVDEVVDLLFAHSGTLDGRIADPRRRYKK